MKTMIRMLLDALASITGDDIAEGTITTMVVEDADFSRSQIRQLQEMRVTAGIPFSLGQGAVRPPSGKEEHINMITPAEVVSISPKTFSFKAVNPREAKLCFMYSSELPGRICVLPSTDAQEFPIHVGTKLVLNERITLDKSKRKHFDVVVTLEGKSVSRNWKVNVRDGEIVDETLSFGGLSFSLQNLFGNDDGQEDKCVICLENPCNVAILPCRHQTLCQDCSASLLSRESTCPICRKKCQLFVRSI